MAAATQHRNGSDYPVRAKRQVAETDVAVVDNDDDAAAADDDDDDDDGLLAVGEDPDDGNDDDESVGLEPRSSDWLYDYLTGSSKLAQAGRKSSAPRRQADNSKAARRRPPSPPKEQCLCPPGECPANHSARPEILRGLESRGSSWP